MGMSGDRCLVSRIKYLDMFVKSCIVAERRLADGTFSQSTSFMELTENIVQANKFLRSLWHRRKPDDRTNALIDRRIIAAAQQSIGMVSMDMGTLYEGGRRTVNTEKAENLKEDLITARKKNLAVIDALSDSFEVLKTQYMEC